MRNVIYFLLFLLFLCLLWYILDSCAIQAHVEHNYQEAFGFLPFAVGLGASLVGNGISNWLSSGNAEHMQTLSYQDNMNLQHDAQNFNSLEAAKNRGYNTAERLAAQQFTQDMWNKNNAYNTPSAQLDRLRAAGLNPLSATMQSSNAQMVGASPQASGSAASSPGNSVGIPATQSFGFASDFANLGLAASQIENIEAQTDLLNVDKQTRLNQNLFELAKARAFVDNTNMDTKNKQKLDQVYDSQMEKNYSEGAAATLNAHTNQQRMLNDFELRLKELALTGREVSVMEYKAITERSLANSNIALNSEQKNYITATVGEVAAKIKEIGANIDVLGEEKAKIEAEKVVEQTKAKFAKEHPNWYIAGDVLSGVLSTIVGTGAIGVGMVLGRRVSPKSIKGFGR